MDKEKLLKELNYALTTEYQAVIQYLSHAAVAKGMDSDTMIPILKHVAEEEMKHAEILRERIFWLDGTPTMDVEKRVMSKDLQGMLKLNAKAEDDAIKMYKNILKMLSHIEDVQIYEAVEEILEDEVEHWEEFTRLMD